jgi:hypothetical protein
MRAAFALALAVAVLAGAASAQAPGPTTPATPAGKPAPDKPGATVSGVTVQGGPRKQCAPKDKDCIALVMAQVKELYPEQLKQFCFQQKMDAMRQDMQANLAGWCNGPGGGASEMCHHYVSPVVKQVCAPDAKPSK